MRKLMYFAAALLVLVGCNKNSQTNKENAPQEVVTIKGSIELPQTPNKIAAPEGWESAINPFTMLWEEGDKIYIYNEGYEVNRQEFTLATGEGSDYGTFTGTTLPDMSAYKVAYGYDPNLDYNGEATYPTYTVPYIADNYRPFAEGTGVNYDFTIANFGPVIGLQLKGDGVFSKIEVALLNNSKATLATYTMTFEDALTLSTESVTKVYFPIQAKEGAVKIAISFYKEGTPDDVLMLTKTTNMPSANKVTTFPELTFHKAYEYVDLGLPSGTKWCTCNIGATEEKGYGDYFAWGETKTYYTSLINFAIQGWNTGKENGYSWQSYCGQSTFKEWNPVPYDENKILKPEYDAATANWGGNWRIPTKAEIDELLTNCNSEWTTSDGVWGRKFTSKIEGYKDKSIFLPAGGGCHGTSHSGNDNTLGGYLSSSLVASSTSCAYYLFFGKNFVKDTDTTNNRWSGRNVRPVCK